MGKPADIFMGMQQGRKRRRGRRPKGAPQNLCHNPVFIAGTAHVPSKSLSVALCAFQHGPMPRGLGATFPLCPLLNRLSFPLPALLLLLRSEFYYLDVLRPCLPRGEARFSMQGRVENPSLRLLRAAFRPGLSRLQALLLHGVSLPKGPILL